MLQAFALLANDQVPHYYLQLREDSIKKIVQQIVCVMPSLIPIEETKCPLSITKILVFFPEFSRALTIKASYLPYFHE